MPSKRWYETPQRLALLFLAVTLISAVALVWLTVELVAKNRSLEKQHAQERVERVADKIVAASHQRLSDLESQLHRLALAENKTAPDHTVLLIAEEDRVTAAPAGALVFYPILPRTKQPPRGVFAEGERYEHHPGDRLKAIERFESLARSEDPTIRAGALLRLGRNQGKAGQIDAALATFAELARLGATDVEGFPAAMLALVARCGILEKAGRPAALSDAPSTLSTFDPRMGQVVELRFFGGLSVQETADVLKVSPETVMRDWKTAKVWLLRELSQEKPAATKVEGK